MVSPERVWEGEVSDSKAESEKEEGRGGAGEGEGLLAKEVAGERGGKKGGARDFKNAKVKMYLGRRRLCYFEEGN